MRQLVSVGGSIVFSNFKQFKPTMDKQFEMKQLKILNLIKFDTWCVGLVKKWH